MRYALALMFAIATPAAAQTAPPSAAVASPVTVESYYRIRWGDFWSFMELYQRNHAPILAEMQKLGFIVSVRTETPVMHMAGDQRWDLRVTITYRDGNAASGSDPGYDKAAKEVSTRLFPDRKTFFAEEERRFAMVEEHWDVVIAPYTE
ncbi:MAG: hypothetical protein ACAH11_03280 [Sphingomonas sp.]